MKNVDYLIVGLGLAGIAFAEQCEAASKSFIVYDQGGDGASRVAAGLYNPVILKRYSLPWKAVEQFDLAIDYFARLEAKLGVAIRQPLAVRKVFSSVEDQNNWFAASDRPLLERFVKTPIVKNTMRAINAPFHFGEVAETGRVDIKRLQKNYTKYLVSKKMYVQDTFDYQMIQFFEGHVVYKNTQANNIIFAEGYSVKKNPYFKSLPLVGNKGEYLIINAPNLKLNAALKSSFFVVPLGEDLYKVGATFNWTDKNSTPTEEAREELITKLATLVTSPYEIVDQEAGIRPTTGDRRPLLGMHPKYPRLVLLNGLGTRGIMAAPLLAHYLFDHIEHKMPLPEEVDIRRFPKKFNEII